MKNAVELLKRALTKKKKKKNENKNEIISSDIKSVTYHLNNITEFECDELCQAMTSSTWMFTIKVINDE